MNDYSAQHRGPRKHLLGLGLVVVLHGLLFWAINSGMARQFVKAFKGPVETQLIEEAKPDIPPPPPPPPPKAPPPPPPPAYVPKVDVPTNAPAAANAIAAVTTAPAPPPPPPPPAPAPAVAAPPPAPLPPPPPPPTPPPPPPPPPMIRVAPSLNTAVPCAQPVYPAASRREEEEGTVGLLIVVDADGRVTDARVDKSSGFARLDDAARIAFSKCQFKPGTLDGKPEPSTVRRNYRWKLEE